MKKVKERVVSCKTLEERPLLSLWIRSRMRKAVKYVFHSSLILRRNKRIKEYCLRNLHSSPEWRPQCRWPQILFRCILLFSFSVLGRKCETGERRGGEAWRERRSWGQGSLLQSLPWRQVRYKRGNNKRLSFWVSKPHRPITLSC